MLLLRCELPNRDGIPSAVLGLLVVVTAVAGAEGLGVFEARPPQRVQSVVPARDQFRSEMVSSWSGFAFRRFVVLGWYR